MKKNIFGYFLLFILANAFFGCSNSGGIIKEIHVGLHSNNQLQIQIDALTTENADAYTEYWPANDSTDVMQSDTVKNVLKHSLVLLNIAPNTNYAYRII